MAALTPQVGRNHAVAAVGEAGADGAPHICCLAAVVQQQQHVAAAAAPLQVAQAQACGVDTQITVCERPGEAGKARAGCECWDSIGATCRASSAAVLAGDRRDLLKPGSSFTYLC